LWFILKDSEPEEDDENYEIIPTECASSTTSKLANRPPVPIPGASLSVVSHPAISRQARIPEPSGEFIIDIK